MRILLSCLQSLEDHRIAAYSYWRGYFVEALVEAGHEVIEVPGVDWAEALTYSDEGDRASWRARTWDSVAELVRREHTRKPIQLFLGYLYPAQVDVAAIQELRHKGIPCVNFFCDNVREFSSVPAEYRPFDLHWVPEFEAQDMYRQAGLPFINAAMPCWIRPELRSIPCQETEPPVFIGSPDILRRDLLARALAGGADFYIRGPGWDGDSIPDQRLSRSPVGILRNQIQLVRRHGWWGLFNKINSRLRPLHSQTVPEFRIRGGIFGAEYVRFTREAMVTLGINRVPTERKSLRRPLVYSRLRDIEAPMLGACYLTEWTEGLEHMFEVGREIETYRTPEELCDKLGELRSNPPRRTAMRASAQRRALTDHSVTRSIGRICNQLGLKCE